MDFCEFAEDYNGAPLGLDEFAFVAARVEDQPKLSASAKLCLLAMSEFEATLAEFGIKMG